MRRALAALTVIVVVLAFSPAAALGGTCDTLKSRLVRGGGSASGLAVMNAESGEVICRRAASTRRPLASNMKMFTTATALARFGPQARIATKVVSDGFFELNGVLRGNLYLQGGGDPALGAPAFYGRFLGGLGTNLFALKAQLRAAGVREVTGRLYGDDSVFDRLRGVADSGYATSPYIGPLSGLSFNSGYSSSRGSSFASDPAQIAVRKFARALRGAGIQLSPGVALRTAPADAQTLAVVRSPNISQLADATNVPSNNFYAEMLLKLVGAHFGGAGTTSAGAAAVERYAREHGVSVRAVDGSGLTRSNSASPSAVVRFLQSIRGEEIGDDFIQSLALTGAEGTVASRTDGSAAAGRCRVKTGTLTGVSNLSGYCFNRSGKVMIFSILMGSVSDLGRAHLEQDRIAAAIASY
ncbi:MAG TPA: D-alanyl-D-alanine carboxypeptidase/D-alanyl-D-alanine-endopeptidase [Solirubrobacterales bacterium]|nr:D-alanyl-D-alanine carboxypeptidase/D-alanyl-D-alanine-endopeptidase [Solirubrobacterales bacterium]